MPLMFWRTRQAGPESLVGTLRQSASVLATAQGDELVLFDMKGEQYYTLNEVGSRVWEHLACGATSAQIAEAILGEYDVPAAEDGDPVERDVIRLLSELYAAGLVVPETQPPRRRL